MKTSLIAATFLSVSTACLGAVGADAPDLDQAIRQHRMGTLIVNASPGTDVRVEQLRHEFWFGCAISSGIFSRPADDKDVVTYKKLFLENFNAAVTENALKWKSMEPRRGYVDYSIVDAILAWTDEHDVPLRGHNVFWGTPGFVQEWLKQMNDQELREALRARANSIGQRYRGRFAEYDLNNEMMHGNYYAQRLGTDITRQMADWVHQADPEALLYVNDYDVLTGNRLEEYIVHVRELREQGVAIAGIGVQGHLHGDTFDASALRNSLSRLAQMNLPICITEFNMPGQRSRFFRDRRQELTQAQEQARAESLVEYYRICFAQPAVHGILMWGFWEGANWIPASSMYKRDWKPTPAADAYRKLVFDQWWTRWEGKTDRDGKCSVPAFFGRYRVLVGDAVRIVELKKADGITTLSY